MIIFITVCVTIFMQSLNQIGPPNKDIYTDIYKYMYAAIIIVKMILLRSLSLTHFECQILVIGVQLGILRENLYYLLN